MTDPAGPAARWPHVRSVWTLVDVLRRDPDVADVVELTPAQAPQWVAGLDVPAGWALAPIDPQLGAVVAPARIITHTPAAPAGAAVETINAFGFTGSPSFRAITSNAGATFTSLGATEVRTEALSIPVRRWSAALRSSAVFTVGDQPTWGQQSNYLAGSDHPHTGRLIVHSVYTAADGPDDPQLGADIAALSQSVYAAFVAALPHIAVD